MDEIVPILRMLERIIAVLIGGFSIYLGYRLFFHLPFERGHEGELELPGIKIVLSRVGPGVFFGVFGTVVLFYSFDNPVAVNGNDRAETGDHATAGYGGFVGASGTSARQSAPGAVTPQQRSKALTSVELINCADTLLRNETGRELADKFSVAIRDAKRALLLSVWDTDSWGSADEFPATGPSTEMPIGLRLSYDSVYGGCPL